MRLGRYGKWMTRWETDLTTRDTNRIVRPREWGFEWLADFADGRGAAATRGTQSGGGAANGGPQGVNPHLTQELYGTDKSVPLTRTGSAAAAVLAPTEIDGAASGLGDLE